jgi:fluoride ion exporter CrcB/FEX
LFEERVGKPSRQALRNFFFPKGPLQSTDEADEEELDRLWVENVWKTYDDIIFISLFTQLGMVFRLAAASWFAFFDETFRSDSALFVNLPLNCLASFLMGFFCDGPSLMSTVETRFTPHSLQQEIQQDVVASAPIGGSPTEGLRNRRAQRQQESPTQWTTPKRVGDAEMREVQLLALERRIRASPCLVLFPVKKEDVDVMDHYFATGYRPENFIHDEENGQALGLAAPPVGSPLEEPPPGSPLDETYTELPAINPSKSNLSRTSNHSETSTHRTRNGPPPHPKHETDAPGVERDFDQIIQDVSTNISTNIQGVSTNITTSISRIRRVSLAEGWDANTTAKAMSDDLLLGLRDGFCGALSTFSSWSSSMVNLLRNGQVSDAVVGYIIGIQLPIVAYRFGQHVAVYLFIWRCRQENRTDERRGYGIRLPQDDDSLDSAPEVEDEEVTSPTSTDTTEEDSEMPSVRAIATALFILSIVTQLTSLSFFTDPTQHQLALSLLFSPLGVLTRWRISRYNRLVPGFPLGTFISNMLGCALSGSLGQLLAGNPGPRERIVLVSLISGFAGSLSSVSALIVEVLAGTDPLLFRFDGLTYATCTIFWGMVIGFIVQTSGDWADAAGTDIGTDGAAAAP